MFRKILIANRGEIACRIIKTAKRMGIATVAVYSDADADALHVEMADEAIHLGPPPAAQSYLLDRQDRRRLQGDRRRGRASGLWLSLRARRLRQGARRRRASSSSAPIPAPSRRWATRSSRRNSPRRQGQRRAGLSRRHRERARRRSRSPRDIGYPVMLKASAGGGGKGMRVAFTDDEVIEGFYARAFGGGVVLRRRSRLHREIHRQSAPHRNSGARRQARQCHSPERARMLDSAPQSEGDRRGALAACSMRRRAREMGAQAVALAKAVDYDSAGTVEFVAGQDKSFYFLEMNTRLQVEHPVTELITGIDLVEQMIRVAAGEPLRCKQEDVKINGWAVESRIYAEDPTRNFLPSIGRLVKYRPPEEKREGGVTVRNDTGVTEGPRDLDPLRSDDREARHPCARSPARHRRPGRRARSFRDRRHPPQHPVPVVADASARWRSGQSFDRLHRRGISGRLLRARADRRRAPSRSPPSRR